MSGKRINVCLSVKYVVSSIEQWLSSWMNQLASHWRKVNEFPVCADFPFVSLPWHTEGIFNCALAVLQGQVDLYGLSVSLHLPWGVMNSRSVLLSFDKECRLCSKNDWSWARFALFLTRSGVTFTTLPVSLCCFLHFYFKVWRLTSAS